MKQRRARQVEAVLDALRRAGRRAHSHGSVYVQLWRDLHESTSGGKLVRPQLVIAAYEGLRGTADDTAAFELLHTALIVHDDVINRDFVRRGRPNISGLLRKRHGGRNLLKSGCCDHR